MHFHLPKPLHGWRAFAGEVGIIVLGVLIALGFEQVVSWTHDRASAAQARAGIRAEIADNLTMMFLRRRTEGCLQRRRQEIAAYLDAVGQGQHLAQPSWIGAPFAPLAGDTAFKSAQSAGKLFLLPQDEQGKFQGFYTESADFNEQSTREWYDWAQLRSLAGTNARLTESEITRLRQALQDARGADWLVREDITGFVNSARRDGVIANIQPYRDEQLASACLPITMPYAEAVTKASRHDVWVQEGVPE